MEWGYGVKNSPIRKCNVGFLLAPHSDQRAISNVSIEPSNVTDGQTDRQNWYSNSRPDAARYALASVAINLFKKLQVYNIVYGPAATVELNRCQSSGI